jgi:membrane protease YdiL (CAAX protease family)
LNPDATLPPQEPDAPPGKLTLHKMFVGKDGLRAGWSLLIFVALFAGALVSINAVGHRLHAHAHKGAQDASQAMLAPYVFIGEGVVFLAVFLVTWIMSRVEGRPSSVYGLGGSHKVARFFTGLAWGVTCLSVLVLILVKTGFLVIDGTALQARDIPRFGTIWLLSFLLVGLLEEYLMRGFVQYTLTRGLAGVYRWAFKTRHSFALGFWTSAVIVSILFGLGHSGNKGESPIGLLSAGLASLVFCLSLWRTGSLWWAIGFHTSWDWAQSFLYGVADSGAMIQHHLLTTHPVGRPILSGGATGPEGSIFIIAALFIASMVILFTLPRADYGDTPDETGSLRANEL